MIGAALRIALADFSMLWKRVSQRGKPACRVALAAEPEWLPLSGSHSLQRGNAKLLIVCEVCQLDRRHQ